MQTLVNEDGMRDAEYPGRFGAKMSCNQILDPEEADATKQKIMISDLIVWCAEVPCPISV